MSALTDQEIHDIYKAVAQEAVVKHLAGVTFDTDSTISFLKELRGESDLVLSIGVKPILS